MPLARSTRRQELDGHGADPLARANSDGGAEPEAVPLRESEAYPPASVSKTAKAPSRPGDRFARYRTGMRILLPGISCAIVAGCAAHSMTYRPHPYPLRMPDDTVIRAHGPIVVFNAQHSTDKVHVGMISLKLVRADLRYWTERAARLVSNELNRYGIRALRYHGGKKINIAVVDVTLARAPGRNRQSVVALEVELEEGKFLTFHGYGTSRHAGRAMDASLTLAVRAMLLEPEVQAFFLRP